MRDKVLVVTGGFGVLGHAVAEAALEAGAYVALPGRDQESKIPEQETGFWCLAGSISRISRRPSKPLKRWPRASARSTASPISRAAFAGKRSATAISPVGPIYSAMNLLTAATATKAALPYLRATQGAIVNVASAPAKKAGAGMGAYAASKAGVLRLTESRRRGREERGRARQCGAADDHRYAAQPRRHAEGRFFTLGEAGRHRQGHFVSVVQRGQGYHRRRAFDFRADMITPGIWRRSAAGDGCP